ncbi:PIG-L family deacetylase [Mariniblastus fucicola]|uniref:1D-myo-inositol 2-acetamido-2-deoxy-alpha-D-glucopyranoside deacetylase n=1 Tax=Mariniblastus fucicola TaxID=980251 RepID=A0A5B9P6W9_9BACT|nr:PIG-L family deacetylase [Mariniblastus fucicola]QEG21289.1 1D-myo-inositol 2-acetamido-2-deoxy-alpha-D-glucopyranoside deacetylase [Mariniblastus fucicola]
MNNEQLDVIAVGAHPDDCEIGCGGTIAKLAKQGLRVGIIDLTDGEPTPLCDDPAIRVAEAQAAAEKLGAVKRIILELPNRRLFDSFEARVELAKQFRIYRPKLVLGIGGKTPLASPDHWQAMQITDAAIFYSRLTKWDEQFDNLPVHRISRQLYYSLLFNGDFSGVGPKQIVHDISDTFDAKMDSIRCYATQFPPEKQSVFERVEHIAKSCGLAAGFAAGEVLTSPSPIASQNLFETLMLN